MECMKREEEKGMGIELSMLGAKEGMFLLHATPTTLMSPLLSLSSLTILSTFQPITLPLSFPSSIYYSLPSFFIFISSTSFH